MKTLILQFNLKTWYLIPSKSTELMSMQKEYDVYKTQINFLFLRLAYTNKINRKKNEQ
jgi:hypothetical protein